MHAGSLVAPRSTPRSFWLALVALVASTLGACRIPITYHDATTYKNLVDLKVDASELVTSFGDIGSPPNDAYIAEVRRALHKAYEYEKGKGGDNKDTIEQFERIVKLFTDDLADYRDGGVQEFGPGYFREAAVVLRQAFDVAIATEAEKNADKR